LLEESGGSDSDEVHRAAQDRAVVRSFLADCERRVDAASDVLPFNRTCAHSVTGWILGQLDLATINRTRKITKRSGRALVAPYLANFALPSRRLQFSLRNQLLPHRDFARDARSAKLGTSSYVREQSALGVGDAAFRRADTTATVEDLAVAPDLACLCRDGSNERNLELERRTADTFFEHRLDG
jgi:hypothetical protein